MELNDAQTRAGCPWTQPSRRDFNIGYLRSRLQPGCAAGCRMLAPVSARRAMGDIVREGNQHVDVTMHDKTPETGAVAGRDVPVRADDAAGRLDSSPGCQAAGATHPLRVRAPPLAGLGARTGDRDAHPAVPPGGPGTRPHDRRTQRRGHRPMRCRQRRQRYRSRSRHPRLPQLRQVRSISTRASTVRSPRCTRSTARSAACWSRFASGVSTARSGSARSPTTSAIGSASHPARRAP
jgi:hypothetical protein